MYNYQPRRTAFRSQGGELKYLPFINIKGETLADLSQRRTSIRAFELVGIVGFAFWFGWLLITFFLLFGNPVNKWTDSTRTFVQLFVFVGFLLAFIFAYLLRKKEAFTPFKLACIVPATIFMCLAPIAALLLLFDIEFSEIVYCIVNLLSGFGGGTCLVCWLDVCGRIGSNNIYQFMGGAFLVGSLLMIFSMFALDGALTVLPIVYCIVSMFLLLYTSARARFNDRAPNPRHTEATTWTYIKEIEPSFIMFGIVFGLSFVYLFNSGVTSLYIGMIFVVAGPLVIFVASFFTRDIGITVVQRILLCITVFACVATPFVSDFLQVMCSGLVVASWAAFCCVHYAIVVKKSTETWDISGFRVIPRRLMAESFGFVIGWAIVSVVTIIFGAHSEHFIFVRLFMAVVLVIVFMVFLPQSTHHDETAMENERKKRQTKVVSAQQSEEELFELRCNTISDLYQLSPREYEILRYLARGRNAGYIQEKLTISPHTVKSHIYSIYRKTDIHSQQKLMDFVQDYPLDVESFES